MTDHKIIDGILFKKMVINGAINLKNNYKKINNLNVFPVPDGDTGTNMQMTMAEGIEKLKLVDDPSIVKMSKVLSDALLMSSKGNSGVILSQFFSGIFEQINVFQKDTIDISQFIDSFVNGYKKAYEAVMKPVEGTILTVLRESIEATHKKKSFKVLKDVLKYMIKHAKISLNKTTDLLPVLKKFNVVDSGGAGFVCILEGMLKILENDELILETYDSFDEGAHSFDNIEHVVGENLKYMYCTEYIVQLRPKSGFILENKRKELLEIGDSLILLENNNLVKIHIHTNIPGDVLTNLLQYGTLKRCKVDNMKEQNENVVKQKNADNASQLSYSLISVVSNEEIKNIFSDMNVNYIINKSDKSNKTVSSKEFNKIFKQLKPSHVIVLTNGEKNKLAAQKALKAFSDLKVNLVETQNIAESYSALLSFDETASLKDNLANMRQNIKKNKIGEVVHLKKSNQFPTDSLNINEEHFAEILESLKNNKDNYLAILEEKILYNHLDLNTLTKYLLKKMVNSDNKFLTIFYDYKKVSQEHLDQIEGFLTDKYPFLEVEKIENDDAMLPYIFILE
ncbi:DAK2 domain-containing protein [Italian clover phyllody phytoplasma]|uniref:DAK2 domain-containing protein n=1 Tax=Italian clover phyllody phytoplasma TaxID=1196420 RepID=UPI0002FAF760|nr:DAK2 domain-containing protein [Italian clover phyllody phytoplasma]